MWGESMVKWKASRVEFQCEPQLQLVWEHCEFQLVGEE